MAKEPSGAQVVSIQEARARAASRPSRGGSHLGAAAAMPLPAQEPEFLDELVVSEPSQVVRMRSNSLQAGAAVPAGAPHGDLDRTGSGVHGHIDEHAVAAGVVAPGPHHKTNRLLLMAAVGGALATLSLAGVVIYLVARGPQVQVREIVRLKSPEELGIDSDVAVARLLAEKQFAAANPTVAPGGGGVVREPPSKKAGGRPTAAGGPAPVKKGEAKTEGSASMAGFFKSGPGTGSATGVAAPNLNSQPEVRKTSARRVSDDEIVRAINRQRGTLNVCYNRALKQDNSLKSVRLDVTVKVGMSGRPTGISIHQQPHRTSFLGLCLSDAIKRWAFPTAGDDYTTVMPLVLQGQ
jgi:hypothetical protein